MNHDDSAEDPKPVSSWEFQPWRILEFLEVGSTNDVAFRAIDREGLLADGSVFVADSQTSGRGQRGRSWRSPSGAGLLASVVLRRPPVRPQALCLSGAGAIFTALKSLGIPVRLKWPNDVYVEGAKISGVLVESRGTSPLSVLGFGLNLSPILGEPSLHPISLAELGVEIPRGELLRSILHGLGEFHRELMLGQVDRLDDCIRSGLSLEGMLVEVFGSGVPVRGQVHRVGSLGDLSIVDRDGNEKTYRGEFITSVRLLDCEESS